MLAEAQEARGSAGAAVRRVGVTRLVLTNTDLRRFLDASVGSISAT